MFGDINHFWVLEPDFVCIVYKFLYNTFKIFFVTDINSVKTFNQISNIGNELEFFFATFDNCSLSGLDVFFKNQNFHHKRDVIWW